VSEAKNPLSKRIEIMAYAARHRGESESGVASAIAQGVSDAGQAARRYANEGMERARDTAAEYWEQGRAKAEEVTETVQTRVRENPMAAVLIAAGVGFLIGMACSSRR
jgi:ElaB/YqjD/DUF883 family membrane-anchored ribosome-binding protein